MPETVAKRGLQLRDSGQSKRLVGGETCLDIGLAQSQMGQQEVGDQHQVQVSYYTGVPNLFMDSLCVTCADRTRAA